MEILIFHCHDGSLKETLQLLDEVLSLSVSMNVFCLRIDHSSLYCQFGVLLLNKELVNSFCLLESILVVQLYMQ